MHEQRREAISSAEDAVRRECTQTAIIRPNEYRNNLFDVPPPPVSVSAPSLGMKESKSFGCEIDVFRYSFRHLPRK